VFAVLSGVCLAGSALSLLSPWFLLFLVPFALFGYITMILALTVYRLAPRGGDLQRRIHDLIVAKAELSAASRALDVGCGSGSLVVKLAKSSADSTVTGVDSWGRDWEYSKELCEDNARIEGVAARTAFLEHSGAALGFADGSFDAVVSCLTFHEIGGVERKSDGVVEALRVLRPGGRYVSSTCSTTGPSIVRPRMFGRRSARQEPRSWSSAAWPAPCRCRSRCGIRRCSGTRC